MDRNTITAFVLIGIILIIFQVVNQPSQEELEQRQQEQQKIEEQSQQAQTQTPQEVERTVTTEANQALFGQAAQEEGGTATLSNDKFAITFNSKGGLIEKVVLNDFKKADLVEDVTLVDDERNRFNYQFTLNGQQFASQDFNFKVQNKTDNSITYRLEAGSGGYIEQIYTLGEAPYSVDYVLNVVGLENQISANELNLQWVNYAIQQEEDIENERYRSSIYYLDTEDDVNYLSEAADDEQDLEKMKIKWLSNKQQFFNNTLIVKGEPMRVGQASSLTPVDKEDPTMEILSSSLYIPYNKSSNFSYPMEFYIGPNDYRILKDKGIELENVVYLGWAIFRWVNVGLIIPLFNFLNKYIASYGIIILILTLLIKTLLFPLTYRSYKSMAKMSVLKPEIEAIKTKFPDDTQKQQQETMKLYSATGVNPVGGCLPQLLQFPILVAMFYFFPSSIELRQESFLWAHDLSTYDSILSLPFSIPFYGAHVSLFTLLMGVSSFLVTRFNSQMNASAANSQMVVIQYVMPFFLLFIFNKFPAALTFYYFLSNIISFAQQLFAKKVMIDEDKLRAELHENKKKPKKKSNFQERLNTMLKEQQAKQEAQKRKSKK